MDPGRYALQQGWDNSALDGYGAVGEPDFRVGVPYRGRRLADDGFPGDPFYPRGGLHRELVERDIYPPPAAVGGWPPSRRSFDEEYGLMRESRRHDKPFPPFHETDTFRETDRYRDNYRNSDGYYNSEGYRDYVFDRPSRFGARDFDSLNEESYEYRRRASRHSRESSHEADHDYGRYNYDSDYERGRKESSWRRRESRDRERDKRGASHDRDISPRSRWGRSRSRSRGRDDRSRSRSPRDRSRGRSHREDSYDDSHYDKNDKRRDRDHDEKRHTDSVSVEPSATLVVKGLSQKTTEEDLYQILAEWGPLRHVRVIRERHSGSSRGFAFIDFPTTEAARSLMDSLGNDGLVFDGRKLFFEYSSKPTGASSGGTESSAKSGHFRSTIQSDWMCTMCGCVNFARRTSCFQCNEGRTEDAPLADVASSTPLPIGKKGSETGPTHVLVVRGLDENADEEILRYEFSKHAPVRDIRLVRDKFTHVSRGFAFVHFNSVEDATKALDATNGTKIEKNGQVLRVAYAKSIHGPGASGNPQSSSLAAAAIEAAAFSQQYDAVGWAPKEYNPDDKAASAANQNGDAEAQKTESAQSGFVWDEASGYYYDAASGFYYDGNTGLYYDSNTGTWYSYDQQTQQYIPCTDQTDSKAQEKMTSQTTKMPDNSTKKVVISAPPATITSKEKSSLPDAIQAAAAAALAAEKKEKDKAKEVKLASKGSLLANKKKMNNVLSMWKQRNHEGQAARVVLDDSQTSSSIDDKLSISVNSSLTGKNKHKPESVITKETVAGTGFSSAATLRGTIHSSSSLNTQSDASNQNSPRPIGNSLGGSLMGVIRSSGRGVVKSDTIFSGVDGGGSSSVASSTALNTSTAPSANAITAPVTTPFKTDLSALSSYAPSVATTSGKRRFSETPVHGSGSKDQPQTTYRDRAAERRSLYGSSTFSVGDEHLDHGVQDSTRDFSYRRGSLETGAMPFPPGVGGGQVSSNAQSYEVVTSDRAIDENNVGNRMLRNMGWQEGSGLGKDGSGITEPVLAQGMEERAGLGRHQRKAVDPELEVQAGDSYRILIQKKAIARFRDMA